MFSSPTGIAATIAIVAGVVLLVVYAMRRGLVHRELDGTLNRESSPDGVLERGPSKPAPSSRGFGAVGAALLAVGLVLALISVAAPKGGNGTSGPGASPNDCAQSWNGCPQATQNP
jgi:hypothetical protein